MIELALAFFALILILAVVMVALYLVSLIAAVIIGIICGTCQAIGEAIDSKMEKLTNKGQNK